MSDIEAAVDELAFSERAFGLAVSANISGGISREEFSGIAQRASDARSALLALLAPPNTKLAAILNACLHNVTIGTTDRIYLRARLEDALALITPPAPAVAITEGDAVDVLSRVLLAAEPGVEEFADQGPNDYWIDLAGDVLRRLNERGYILAAAPPAPAVAITEAMVEAAAAAFWASDTMMGQTQSDWDDVTPRWREMVRRDALTILNAALAAAQAQPGGEASA